MLVAALGELGFDHNEDHGVLKCKATRVTAKGMIGMTIQIYPLLSGSRSLSILEVCVIV